jgi:type VI secretion system protein ImpH
MTPSPQGLDQQLVEQPYRFDFFQAVRLMGLILTGQASVGGTAQPGQEIVRFRVRQSLEFPASAIHSLDTETDPAEMVVAFFGLTGVQGALPHHYTEHILGRAAAKDYAMAAFFDLFNHRLISLFYRAWEKHCLPARYQAAQARSEGADGISTYLFDLIGMGTSGLRNRIALPDAALLRYGGLLGQWPRSGCALVRILRDYFQIRAEIEEFQGAWHQLGKDELCDLEHTDIRNELGNGAIAGDSVWDPQAGFRVRLGPLPLARFLAFLPGKEAACELIDLVRLFVGDVPAFAWQVVLRAAEVPWCRLGDDSAAGPRLGWCAWLKTEEFCVNPDDAVFAEAA